VIVGVGPASQRTVLSPLAVAASLLSKHVGPPPGGVLFAAADVLPALVLLWFGRRRDRRIRSLGAAASGRLIVSGADREVVGAAIGAAAIALGTGLVVLIGT
jgi:hypothetical protein